MIPNDTLYIESCYYAESEMNLICGLGILNSGVVRELWVHIHLKHVRIKKFLPKKKCCLDLAVIVNTGPIYYLVLHNLIKDLNIVNFESYFRFELLISLKNRYIFLYWSLQNLFFYLNAIWYCIYEASKMSSGFRTYNLVPVFTHARYCTPQRWKTRACAQTE
ncbi:hypothetical protein V1478_007871 [Vespula squamosa]|uniref:Uncharacterized protein n=1 Tax=Vespula squamosa TaxID=30214 RepID=A0ABD2AX67_VESSQ